MCEASRTKMKRAIFLFDPSQTGRGFRCPSEYSSGIPEARSPYPIRRCIIRFVFRPRPLPRVSRRSDAPIRFSSCPRNCFTAVTLRSNSATIHKSNYTATATKFQAQVLGFWHLCEQSRPNREAPGELFRRTARRDRAMRGWNVQLQPERDLLTSWRRCQVVMNRPV